MLSTAFWAPGLRRLGARRNIRYQLFPVVNESMWAVRAVRPWVESECGSHAGPCHTDALQPSNRAPGRSSATALGLTKPDGYERRPPGFSIASDPPIAGSSQNLPLFHVEHP
jgi:hypothetical protein